MDKFIPEVHEAVMSGDSRFAVTEEIVSREVAKVFGWAFAGLLLTAVTAWWTANSGLMQNIILNGGILLWIIMLAPLGIVLLLSARIHKMSADTAAMLFFTYCALSGVGLSLILLVFTGASIMNTFLATSLTFAVMAVYGYTTNTDLTKFGQLALFALIGIIIAMVVNWFLGSSTLDLIISGIGVIIFTVLIAYDTQKIKEMVIYDYGMTGSVSGRAVIIGALNLVLDFINLFLFLLRFMGDRE